MFHAPEGPRPPPPPTLEYHAKSSELLADKKIVPEKLAPNERKLLAYNQLAAPFRLGHDVIAQMF